MAEARWMQAEGVCQLCHKSAALYLGLLCFNCKDAIDRVEPWTLVFPDMLDSIRHLEDEDDRRAAA